MRKLFTTLILCIALVQPGFAQSKTNDPPIQPQGTFLVAFVLGCVMVGAYLIWKIRGTLPSQTSPVTLVLEKSVDGKATWTCVFTNTVRLQGTNAIEFFRDRMTDDMAFYRVRVQR